MIKTKLIDFIKIVNGQFWNGDPHAYFESISTDTRKLKRGDCFFALVGKNFDAHDFIKDAITKNASVIVFSRNNIQLNGNGVIINLPALIKVSDTLKALTDFATYLRKSLSGRVIAIGGSNGKTTTKNLLYSILSLDGPAIKSYGSYNNAIGVSLTIFEITGEEKYLILELGISVIGEMEKLSKIASPDVAVLTNIGVEHLEGLKTIENVFKEETKIFEHLQEGGIAVVNMDDPFLKNFREKNSTKYRFTGFGIQEEAEITASDIKILPEGLSFTLKYGKGGDTIPIFIKILGRFNLLNALAAAAVSYSLNISAEKVKAGLENFVAVPGRMEKTILPNGCIIINDAYNANPSSMREALRSFCEIFLRKRKVLVLGDMLELGQSSMQEHEKLGEFLLSLTFDDILLCGTAMESAYKKIESILSTEQVKYFKDKDELAYEVIQEKYINSESAVFLKASHAMGFEELYKKIVEEF